MSVGALADPMMWFEAASVQAVAMGEDDRRAPPDPTMPVSEPVMDERGSTDVIDLTSGEKAEDVMRCGICDEFPANCFAAPPLARRAES